MPQNNFSFWAQGPKEEAEVISATPERRLTGSAKGIVLSVSSPLRTQTLECDINLADIDLEISV